MVQARYEIYYDFYGMIQGDHLHSKLSGEEALENINRLPDEFELMLDDENAKASISTSVGGKKILSICTVDDQSVINERLANALKGLSLFAKKFEEEY